MMNDQKPLTEIIYIIMYIIWLFLGLGTENVQQPLISMITLL